MAAVKVALVVQVGAVLAAQVLKIVELLELLTQVQVAVAVVLLKAALVAQQAAVLVEAV